MKTFLKPKTLLLAFMMISLAMLSSCDKDFPGDEKPGTGHPKPSKSCNVTGTFTRVMCGTSIYDNYWIRLDNGIYLQPCATDVQQLCPWPITEGTKVKFGFQYLSGSSACDSMVTCMAMVPKSTKVKITCLQIISQPPADCEQEGTVVQHFSIGTINMYDTCYVKLIRLKNGDTYEPVNQELLKEYSDNQQIRVGLNPVPTFAITCSGQAAAEILCIRKDDDTKPCKAIEITNATPRGSNVAIQDARIEGDQLKLKVSFSGCSDLSASFKLLWDGSMMKSYPAQVELFVNNPTPELCEAYFVKEICFDLGKLRVNSPSSKSIRIRISGYNGGELLY